NAVGTRRRHARHRRHIRTEIDPFTIIGIWNVKGMEVVEVWVRRNIDGHFLTVSFVNEPIGRIVASEGNVVIGIKRIGVQSKLQISLFPEAFEEIELINSGLIEFQVLWIVLELVYAVHTSYSIVEE